MIEADVKTIIIYETGFFQLEKALCELNRRIYEHDKCVRKMQNKSEITLKVNENRLIANNFYFRQTTWMENSKVPFVVENTCLAH